MAKRTRMIVLAKAAAGRVDELATWYRDSHIPDLLRISGFVAAEFLPATVIKCPDGLTGWDFVSIYTIEGDDPMASLAEAGRRMGTPQMPICDALESASTISILGISSPE
jgi:hypothetical protein